MSGVVSDVMLCTAKLCCFYIRYSSKVWWFEWKTGRLLCWV